MSWLIGKTGYSVLDYWTLAHLAFWFFVGSTLAALKVKLRFGLSISMVVAFAWEGFEKFAEREWPTVWLSPESWMNSWVSDPMTCLLSVGMAYYGYTKWRPT